MLYKKQTLTCQGATGEKNGEEISTGIYCVNGVTHTPNRHTDIGNIQVTIPSQSIKTELLIKQNVKYLDVFKQFITTNDCTHCIELYEKIGQRLQAK